MWHHPAAAAAAQFGGGGGGCWDSATAAAGVDGSAYPPSVYGCSFTGAGGGGGGPVAGGGSYVVGYDGSSTPVASGPPPPPPPYYGGMYGLPSLAAAAPWSTCHSPSLGYNAVRPSVRPSVTSNQPNIYTKSTSLTTWRDGSSISIFREGHGSRKGGRSPENFSRYKYAVFDIEPTYA